LSDHSSTTVVIASSIAGYDFDDSVVPIDDLISALETAKEDGATHAVAATGNHRGAKWAKLDLDLGWADD
jgi:hypothetical protein